MHLALPRREHACLKTAARLGCLLLCLLAACGRVPAPTNPASLTSPIPGRPRLSSPATATVPATSTIPEATKTEASPVPTASALPADFWQKLPIIPGQISPRVREIYQNGLALGNNPHVFSRIGDCTSAAPAFLVTSEVMYPGWQARVNGAAAPLLMTNAAFRGLSLPTGVSDIVMEYRPRFFWPCAAISLAALAFAVGAMALRRKRAGV